MLGTRLVVVEISARRDIWPK